MNLKQSCLLSLLLAGLSACTQYNQENYRAYTAQSYEEVNYYPAAFSNETVYDSYQSGSKGVHVPESFHVGSYRSPVKAKIRDHQWIQQQSAQGYTIELADDQKASYVAEKLSHTPKTDRMAEIKYNREGKIYYKGIYGTYSTQEEAQRALSGLPETIKKDASIRQWREVQNISQ